MDKAGSLAVAAVVGWVYGCGGFGSVLSALVVSYFILYANPSYSDMTLRSWIYLSDDSPNLLYWAHHQFVRAMLPPRFALFRASALRLREQAWR
ncbi:hypothetical protein BJX68DRAFT_129797 [Aspergillus pseudodeflectus]|uniref:Uncharacterized protein n=1 Tax=Aspergillus pseudodeflectus TaxID=176178 RepID=A0ABR4K0F1_9EURO